MKLTIGMAHHTDFHGAYFTIQDIRKELIFNNRKDLLDSIEFIVVDNAPASEHSKALKNLIHQAGCRLVEFSESEGTSQTRNKIIEEATGDFVLVMDCHVMLCPVVKVIEQLFKFMKNNPDTNNLHHGPLIYDGLGNCSTHFNDFWGAEMWGQWGQAWTCQCNKSHFTIVNKDNKATVLSLVKQRHQTECDVCGIKYPETHYPQHEVHFLKTGCKVSAYLDDSFEIPMQGLGLFFVRKSAWLKFNKHARAFGAEEGYIHEKYRRNGYKTLCLPFLKWIHRFARPDGVKYPLTLIDKLRNYILGFTEIGLSLEPIKKHFMDETKRVDQDTWDKLINEAKALYPDPIPQNTTEEPKPNITDKNKPPFITCLCPTYKRPELLANAIKCFETQYYPKDRRELLILDDAGQYQGQIKGENWRIISQTERERTLAAKFNKLASMANPETEIFAVWEDDEIFLPGHLGFMVRVFKRGQAQFFAPNFAYSTYMEKIGDVVKEKVTGRFHGAWAYSKALWDVVGGYEDVASIDFTDRMYEKCSAIAKPTNYDIGNPTFIHRFARADYHIGYTDMPNKDPQEIFQTNWNYIGYIPVEKITSLEPKFDHETKLIFEKFAIKVE
jgi:glycosyltransferase involved in cell wall biosynthesis